MYALACNSPHIHTLHYSSLSAHEDQQSLAQLLHIIKTPMIFTVSFLLLWVILLAAQISIQLKKGSFLQGFQV
jgi:uncharacterized membrane protein